MTIRLSNMHATYRNVAFQYTGIGFNANVVGAAANSSLLDLKTSDNTMFIVYTNGDAVLTGNLFVLGTINGNGIGGGNGGGVVSVGSGNGLTGGPITGSGTLSILANTGIIANSSGLFLDTSVVTALTVNNATHAFGKTENALNVNSAASATSALSANNSDYLGGTAAAGYQTTAGLSANVATLTSNNTSFVGSVTAANVVSNAQLQANLANYQTTAGLSANVATLTSNNTSFVGSTTAANVVSNAQLQANLVNYQTTAGMSSYQTTAGLSANVATLTANNTSFVGSVTAANVVSNAQLQANLANYQTTAGMSSYQTTAGLAANVATLTSNNATNAFGKTEANLNVNNALTANNSSYLEGSNTAFFTNASNMSSGTLPYARLGANVANTSGDFTITGNWTFNTSVTFGNSSANAKNTLGGITQEYITITTTGTSAQNVDSFAKATYRSARYFASIKDNNANAYHTASLSVIHNDGAPFSVEFGVMYTNTSLGLFSTTSNTTHILVQFTPTSSNTTVKMEKVLISI